jgi:hypothetical protein
VRFRYKPEIVGEDRPLEFGLIAEEVAEVYPELAVYDEGGEPYTVRYHLLSAMLLNEVKKQHHTMETLLLQNEALLARLEQLESKVEGGTR